MLQTQTYSVIIITIYNFMFSQEAEDKRDQVHIYRVRYDYLSSYCF